MRSMSASGVFGNEGRVEQSYLWSETYVPVGESPAPLVEVRLNEDASDDAERADLDELASITIENAAIDLARFGELHGLPADGRIELNAAVVVPCRPQITASWWASSSRPGGVSRTRSTRCS